VIVKFDGKDIHEMRDLPRVVADTPVGKDVPVVLIRKGKEETKTVKLGRLEDGEKQASLRPQSAEPDTKPVVKKSLGLDLASLSDNLRQKYKIKDSVKGVVIVGVDASQVPAEKRLSAGDVIVLVQNDAISNADEMQAKLDQLKKDGRRVVTLLVSSPDGDTRFVALSLQ
jgi:serine protease Do